MLYLAICVYINAYMHEFEGDLRGGLWEFEGGRD